MIYGNFGELNVYEKRDIHTYNPPPTHHIQHMHKTMYTGSSSVV